MNIDDRYERAEIITSVMKKCYFRGAIDEVDEAKCAVKRSPLLPNGSDYSDDSIIRQMHILYTLQIFCVESEYVNWAGDDPEGFFCRWIDYLSGFDVLSVRASFQRFIPLSLPYLTFLFFFLFFSFLSFFFIT